jgi:hypothetical protein
MLDESKLGLPSPEPVKRERKRSNGRQKLKKTASGAKVSHLQSDASSADNSLSKSEPESLPTGLQKKSNEAIASDDTFVVRIDAATNSAMLKTNVRIFGTNNDDSTRALAKQVATVVLNAEGKHDVQNLKWALNTVYGMGPKDELEGLLAAQMIGVHSLAMECLRRASLEGQTTEGMDANINRATKLLRTFTAQMEALNRHRGKVSQQMVVGNVNVNEGGQAIVGPVSHEGRGKASPEDEIARNSVES